MIALTQARVHEPARAFLARKREQGKTGKEAVRALERHLTRTLFRLLKSIAERTNIAIESSPNAPCLT